MTELTAPIVLKDEAKRIVYGPVLIPDEPDSDGDVVSKEKIENVAHSFVESYGNIDLQHSLNNVGNLVESYLLPVDLPLDDDQVIPKGTWMLGTRVTNDNAWKDIQSGALSGFSIMAVQRASVGKSAAAEKRTTLEDLGDDWIVNAVSLVDEPAVPRAKFLAIKSKKKEKNVQALTLQRLANMFSTTKESDTMDEEKLAELLGTVVAQHLEPLHEQLAKIAEALGSEEEEEPEEDDADKAAGDQLAGKSKKGTDSAPAAKEPADTAQGDEQPVGEHPAFSGDEIAQLRHLAGLLRQEEPETAAEPAGKSAPFSHRLPGQDADDKAAKSEPERKPDRDAFGRKIRN